MNVQCATSPRLLMNVSRSGVLPLKSISDGLVYAYYYRLLVRLWCTNSPCQLVRVLSGASDRLLVMLKHVNCHCGIVILCSQMVTSRVFFMLIITVFYKSYLPGLHVDKNR